MTMTMTMTMTVTMKIVYFDTKYQLKIYKLITIKRTKNLCQGDPIGAGVLVVIMGPPEIK